MLHFTTWVVFIYKALLTVVQSQVVTIATPLDPYIISEGEPIFLRCFTQNNRLSWRFGPKSELINPYHEENYQIRDLFERPSNYSESNLTVLSATLQDMGSYTCKSLETQDNFQVYVTVLNIDSWLRTDNETNNYSFGCDITGFTFNPPEIVGLWKVESQSMYNVSPPFENKKLLATQEDNKLRLVLKDPSPKDLGNYSCVFRLITREPQREFVATIKFETSAVNSVAILHCLVSLIVLLLGLFVLG